jgi:hypothetical protein
MATLFGGYTVAKVCATRCSSASSARRTCPGATSRRDRLDRDRRPGVALTLKLARAPSDRRSARRWRSPSPSSFAALYTWNRHWVAGAFYVWAGSQALMILSYFWLLALELWDARAAQAILPLFSAPVSSAACSAELRELGGQPHRDLGPSVDARGTARPDARDHARARSQLPSRPFLAHAGSGTSALEILRHSPFLRYLAATLALSVVVSTLVDFQFKYAAQQAYPTATG